MGKLCNDCDKCIYHNPKWTKECEWSPYADKKVLGKPGEWGDQCVLLVEK